MKQKKKYESFISSLGYGILIAILVLSLLITISPIYVITNIISHILTISFIGGIILLMKFIWGYDHDAWGRPRVKGSVAPKHTDTLFKLFISLISILISWFLIANISNPLALSISKFLKSISVPLTLFAGLLIIILVVTDILTK